MGVLTLLTRRFVKLEVSGLENLPKDSGGILILNHVSLLDPILAGVALRKHRQVKALAKESLFRKPIIGPAMKSMGHIPVLRGTATAHEALAVATERLAEGELVGLYPEGTIPETLDKLGPFKSGAARLALASEVPVIPVVSWGAQNIVPRGKGKRKGLWRAFRKRPVHRLHVGEPMGPFLGDPADRDRVAKVTAELEARIKELLPLVKPAS